MRELLSIRILGNVQGVFFRHSAKKKADELGIVGFTRNELDGSVYIEVEGEKENLDKFIVWCRQGPPLAKIEKVDFEFREMSGKFSEFEIK